MLPRGSRNAVETTNVKFGKEKGQSADDTETVDSGYIYIQIC